MDFIKKIVILFLLQVIIVSMNAQVGIGTTPPTQGLDVVGDIQFSGALMPGTDEGTTGQILLSSGPATSLTWGAAMINQANTSKIKKNLSPVIARIQKNGGRATLTIPDGDCTTNSTCMITWRSLPTGPSIDFFGFDTSYEARNGEWVFTFINRSSTNYTNLQFNYVAFY